jgi:3-deoxy-D-manno-octulosonic-acid transferase
MLLQSLGVIGIILILIYSLYWKKTQHKNGFHMLTLFLSLFSVILRVHDELIKTHPSLLLILVPRHPQDSKNISLVC